MLGAAMAVLGGAGVQAQPRGLHFGGAGPPAGGGGPGGPDRPGGPLSLGDVLFGSPWPDTRSAVQPDVARYSTEIGRSFVLDRPERGPALLRFEASPEVWVLQAHAGPRGDVIYKDDLGQPVLRATRLGGLTLFTSERPGGVAAAMAGVAAGLRAPPVLGSAALFQAMAQASARASRAAGRLVSFEALDLTPGSEPVFADAANCAAQAFVSLDRQGPGGRALAERFARVNFLNGRAPSADAAGPVLTVVVTPGLGFAGRPSSGRIALVMSRH